MNLINNFLIGGMAFAFCPLLQCKEILQNNYIIEILYIAILGTALNSLASLVLDPLLIKCKVVKKRDYKKYLVALAADPQINELNLQRVFYRDASMSMIFAALLAQDVNIAFFIFLGAILFSIRMLKFNDYILKRVDACDV